ncbi:MAG: methyltransferase domain-containing protein [Patescibacteria group bacterium]
MSKLNDFLAGRQILAEVNSPFNGVLTVVKELAWGTHIMAGGITQSGGIAQDIWKTVFRTLAQKNFKSVLIVGLGGGGIAKLVNKNWPAAKITGIEIDPVIVELGNTYLGLNKIQVKTLIGDGLSLSEELVAKNKKFDLICVDTYIGQTFPKKFESLKFLKIITRLLTKNGIVIFNRLYYKEKVNQALEFKKIIEKIYPHVEVVKPEANIMFTCYNLSSR